MKILITGSAGRVGRAIYINLMKSHDVIGIDRVPCSTTDIVGDVQNLELVGGALENIDVIVHTAALHAPHVGLVCDAEFTRINVEATEQLALQGVKCGVKHFVFTSTTALYGYASTPLSHAGWINEHVTPQPKTIYHTSKIEAERKLQKISGVFNLPVTVLQMSRCFPEPADRMAVYRMTRGIDVRDVASAHRHAIEKRLSGFRRYIISGKTPFVQSDSCNLLNHAAATIEEKAPKLANVFQQRGWPLPESLDRIYDSSLAQRELGWWPRHGFESILEMWDNELPEVLPPSITHID